jgi:CRP-like cAMP-binding protein/PAS domain-containing protein
MNREPLVDARRPSGLETEAEFTRWVRQVVKGAAELQAFEAGQIDAVMDTRTNSVVLSPLARTALQGSNRFVRALLDALPVEACVLDSAGTVITTNRAWRTFVDAGAGAGLGVREGANFLAACKHAIGIERAHATAVAKGFRKVLAGVRQQYSRRYVCSGRIGYWTCTLTIAPIAADGVIHGLITRENIRALRDAGTSRSVRPINAGASAATSRARRLNRLLATLPDKEFERLLSFLEPVKLCYGQVLYEPGESIDYVYFPIDCPVSLLTVVDGNQSLEVGLVGREGLIGTPLALGGTTSPVRALVQGNGTAVRMHAENFQKKLKRSPALRRALFRYIGELMMQVARNAACNRFHVMEKRLARWLLMTRERLSSSSFYLTHDFLADILGARRESVTESAHKLKRQKLISYNRGNITILNRRGLEAACCSCFQQIKIVAPERL